MQYNFFRNFDKLITDRLKLRKLTLEDTENVFEFTSLEETSKGLSWYPHKNLEETKNFINSILEKYENDQPSQWAVELLNEKKVIGIAGFITFFPEHSKGEIAYVLSPKYQGKGYMTEALKSVIKYGFDVMKMNRIEAKCEIDNFASEKVMQKLRMRQEGCFYQYIFRKNEFRDYKFYSILKKDWNEEK